MNEVVCTNPEHDYVVKAWSERRCTGRTSRMLRDAIIHSLQGKRVLVVGLTEAVADTLKHTVKDVARRLGVNARVMSNVKFIGERQFRKGDWTGFTVLVDHAVSGEEQ